MLRTFVMLLQVCAGGIRLNNTQIAEPFGKSPLSLFLESTVIDSN